MEEAMHLLHHHLNIGLGIEEVTTLRIVAYDATGYSATDVAEASLCPWRPEQ